MHILRTALRKGGQRPVHKLIFVIFLCFSLPSAYAQTNNTITLDNQSGKPALAKLIGPTDHTVEVLSGQKKTVHVKEGEYHLFARYGSDPNQYTYSKGDPFTVKETATQYSTITITLHKVVGGDYPSRRSSREEFEEASRVNGSKATGRPQEVKTSEVLYSGQSQCTGMQIRVSFVYNTHTHTINSFKAGHSCIGRETALEYAPSATIDVNEQGAFSYEDRWGNFIKGIISADGKASGKAVTMSSPLAICDDGKRYKPCTQWTAAVSHKGQDVLGQKSHQKSPLASKLVEIVMTNGIVYEVTDYELNDTRPPGRFYRLLSDYDIGKVPLYKEPVVFHFPQEQVDKIIVGPIKRRSGVVDATVILKGNREFTGKLSDPAYSLRRKVESISGETLVAGYQAKFVAQIPDVAEITFSEGKEGVTVARVKKRDGTTKDNVQSLKFRVARGRDSDKSYRIREIKFDIEDDTLSIPVKDISSVILVKPSVRTAGKFERAIWKLNLRNGESLEGVFNHCHIDGKTTISGQNVSFTMNLGTNVKSITFK